MGNRRLGKGVRARRIDTDAEKTQPLPSLRAGLDALGKYANKPMKKPKGDFTRGLFGGTVRGKKKS